MIPKNIKSLQAQSRQLQARLVDKNTLVVESVSNPQASHIVTVQFAPDGEIHARCTCPWALHNGIACSHVMAALDHLAALKARKLSFWSSHDEARRQKHRTFSLKGSKNEAIWITSRPG
jgi:hypothetical protein